ncbi:hypothetical protein [Sulfitobacter aestuariivivens]|uniref:Uncharacterized protein n=1 Tax=Sulfitobacter aestuariivivens TaxID=2766981 RepID=A0A927D7D0_9RHOB|nr:hypothetical protein [Sulfitobacter aestuariivivens]MBD3666274.1 hypothetical protein [Sulfitobacter aestuariivivens]
MLDPIEECLLLARSELAAAKRLLDAEIRSYPTPIAGCDVQFNHLLADRQRVRAAMVALGSDVFVPTPRSPTPQAGVESR